MTDPKPPTLFEGDTIPQIVAELDSARARKSDPDTSHFAADSNVNREAVEEHVRHLFMIHGPMTDHELTLRYFVDSTSPASDFESPRKRRSSLSKAGVLVATLQRRPSRTGRPAIVWELA